MDKCPLISVSEDLFIYSDWIPCPSARSPAAKLSVNVCPTPGSGPRDPAPAPTKARDLLFTILGASLSQTCPAPGGRTISQRDSQYQADTKWPSLVYVRLEKIYFYLIFVCELNLKYVHQNPLQYFPIYRLKTKVSAKNSSMCLNTFSGVRADHG